MVGRLSSLKQSAAENCHRDLPLEETAEELAVRAQGGGTAGMAAFSELVERYNGRLYSFLLRRLPAADAEDVTQEAFIRAWQRIGTYNPQYRFSTWLFTIATRMAISHGRSSRRTQTVELKLHSEPLAGGGGFRGEIAAGEAEEMMLRLEERTKIWTMVGELLSVDQQTAVWLRYVEDMAIADIARVMGKTQVGVRVMLFRARGLLAERLERTDDGVVELKTGAKLPGARCAGGAA